MESRTTWNESSTSVSSEGSPGVPLVVDVEGEPEVAGVLEHELAELVVGPPAAGRVDHDGDGAVTVVGDDVVLADGREDLGEGAAGEQVGGHEGAVHALPVVRERRGPALVEDEVAGDVARVLRRQAVAVVGVVGEDVVEVALVDRLGDGRRAGADQARDGQPGDENERTSPHGTSWVGPSVGGPELSPTVASRVRGGMTHMVYRTLRSLLARPDGAVPDIGDRRSSARKEGVICTTIGR